MCPACRSPFIRNISNPFGGLQRPVVVGGFDPLEIARTVAQQMAAAAQKAIAAGSERAPFYCPDSLMCGARKGVLF